MDSDDKQSVRLSIGHQTFTLRVTGDPADMVRAANEVDELMSTIARSGNLDTFRVAVLACLHLQDRVHVLEHELEALHTRVSDRSTELASLLDRIVP